MMLYLQLFVTFFKIGLFGFGGGAAMMSLIQFELVETHGWLTMSEFTNMVAVSQITPGPIGINCATYAGYLSSGNVWGSAIATLALVLPSFLIMLIIAKMISKFKDNMWVQRVMSILRPTIVGMIAAAALLLVTEESFGEGYADWSAWIIFGVSFIVMKWFKLHPMLTIVIAAVVGLIIY